MEQRCALCPPVACRILPTNPPRDWAAPSSFPRFQNRPHVSSSALRVSMRESDRLPSGAYLIALVAVAGVGVIRLAVSGTLGGSASFLAFILAVTLVAGYGGLGPGLVTTVLGAFLGADVFLPLRPFPWVQ